MALDSFSTLKSAIADWMFDRPDLATNAGTFISLCESDMNRLLQI